jgi:hypothetical protein
MKCPCCGSEYESGTHPALERIATAVNPPGRVATRIISELVASFGQWVPISRLISAAYFDRPDGGPLTADATIQVIISQNRGRLLDLGLKIEGKSSGRRMVWIKKYKKIDQSKLKELWKSDIPGKELSRAMGHHIWVLRRKAVEMGLNSRRSHNKKTRLYHP